MSIWKKWLGGGSGAPDPAPKKPESHGNAAARSGSAPTAAPSTRLTTDPPPVAAVTPVRKIAYDPNLIDGFKRDHADLLTLFGAITKSHAAKDYADTAVGLQRFKTALQAHVLAENVRFYAYLQATLLSNSEDAQLMHEFRREMNAIVRGVTDFLTKYAGPDTLSASTRTAFEHDVGQVGALLQQRIDREERSLYPLYH